MSREYFRDLHQERSADTRHIRLISEGGSSPAWSPGPVCIDSIQVTQSCTTESHHTVYRSATGACTMFASPDTALFSVPSRHAAELDQEKIPAVLRNRFRQQKAPLSEKARAIIKDSGRVWSISDRDRRYSVRRVAERLTVYRDLDF